MTPNNPMTLAMAMTLTLAAPAVAATPTAPRPPSEPAAPVPAEAPVALLSPEPPSVEAIRRYEESLEAAEAEQRAALEAVEAARSELNARAREQALQAREARAATAQARDAEREELRAVQRELQRAHENLRRASREVAQVHREINRPAARVVEYRFSGDETDRAVIGVILGGETDAGVKVLGVSPDGPAERAGMAPGDTIVAVMDQPLAGGNAEPQRLLVDALKDIEVGDEISVTVLRDGHKVPLELVASKREPFTWHSWSQLATAPVDDPMSQVFIERIEMPEIDEAALEERMQVLRQRFSDGDWEFEFEDFSDFGDAVISGTDIWIGMPLTRGLRMTEIEPGLGRYFDTDQGVLVLQALDDNGLKLQSGDVILRVGNINVTRPADVMRALRDVESGATLQIAIKRDRRDQTLEIQLPQERVSFWRVD